MIFDKKNEQDAIKGRIFVLIAAILWGTAGTAQTFAPQGASPAVVGTFRILIGGSFLCIYSFLKEDYLKNFSDFFTPVLFLTAFCQAMFQLCYFSAINLTGVAVGAMVAIGSSPVFAGILGKIFDSDRLGRVWFISTFTAVTGLVCLSLGHDNTGVKISFAGIAFALGAGFSYALFTLVAKRIMTGRSGDSVIGVSFLIGTIYMIPFFFIYPSAWLFTKSGFIVVCYLGIVSAGLSYMFYGRGLKSINVSTVGTLTLGEPLTASLLGIFLLNEPVTIVSAAGMILIFVSQIIIIFDK